MIHRYSACDDGIVCEGQSTLCQVVGNWIQSADGYGMWIRFGASPSIRNNDITSGHGDGVGVWHPNSAPTLASNRIVKNEGNGLTIAKVRQDLNDVVLHVNYGVLC